MRSLALFLTILAASAAICQEAKTCQVTVPVTVTGRRATDLRDTSFTAKVQNKIVPLKVARREASRIFVLLDHSGSMRESGKWERGERIAHEFVTALPEAAPLTLVVIPDTDKVATSRADALKLLKSIASQPAYGRTVMYELLDSITRRERVTVSDLIIVISDGTDSDPKLRNKNLVRQQIASVAARMSLVLIQDNLPVSEQERLEPIELADVVRKNGGVVLWVNSDEKDSPLHSGAQLLQLSPYYDLSVTRQADPTPIKWKLEVVGEDGKHVGSEHLHLPSTLPACADSH